MNTGCVYQIRHAQKRTVSVVHPDKDFIIISNIWALKIPVADSVSVCEQLISIAFRFYSQFCFIKIHWITSSIQFGVFDFVLVFCGADICCFRWSRCLAGLKLNLWICYEGIFYFYSSGNVISTNRITGGNNNWHHRLARAMNMMFLFLFFYMGNCTVKRSISTSSVLIWIVSHNGQVLKNKKCWKVASFSSIKNLLQRS